MAVLFVLAQLPAGGSGCPMMDGSRMASCCCDVTSVDTTETSCCTETELPETTKPCACGFTPGNTTEPLASVLPAPQRDSYSPDLIALSSLLHDRPAFPPYEAIHDRGIHNDAGPPGHVPTYILHRAILR
jgi:hypothetical protein